MPRRPRKSSLLLWGPSKSAKDGERVSQQAGGGPYDCVRSTSVLRPLALGARSSIHPSVELGPGSGGRAFHSCSHRLHSFPNPKAIPRGLPACLPASRLNKLGGLWSRSVAPTTVMSSSPTLLPTRARPSRLCQAYDLDEVVTYLGWLRGEEGGS